MKRNHAASVFGETAGAGCVLKYPRVALAETSVNIFRYSEKCLLCARNVRKTEFSGVCRATRNLRGTLLVKCNERGSDKWTSDVLGRVSSVTDLSEVNAAYHRACLTYFRMNKLTPPSRRRKTCARKPSLSAVRRNSVFQKIAETFKAADSDGFGCASVSDLMDDMRSELRKDGERPYSYKTFVTKLKKGFLNDIVLSEAVRPKMVWQKEQISRAAKRGNPLPPPSSDIILDQINISVPEPINEDKQKLVKKLAKIISEEAEVQGGPIHEYPPSEELSDLQKQMSLVPPTLIALLQALIKRPKMDLKVASIGQAITREMMPRKYLGPLLWGLSCKLFHEFRSKDLLSLLNSFGFAVSYREVQMYITSAARCQSEEKPAGDATHFIHYVADNIDHNRGTIDGARTLHGMGIIGAVHPASISSSRTVVKRLTVTLEELRQIGMIPLKFYSCRRESFQKTVIANFIQESETILLQQEKKNYAEILWKTAFYFRRPSPCWSGLMQMIVEDRPHPGPSSKLFFPIIDLNPSDETCIYSTLNFVVNHAMKYNVHPVLTFDQPLYWKALTMIENEPEGSFLKLIVLMLGGFHTRMSYLGSIAYICKGSGLFEACEQIFPTNSVRHIFSGKSVARAERCHFLIETALNTIIMNEAYYENDESADDLDFHQDIQDLAVILEGLIDKTCAPEDVADSQALLNVESRLNDVRMNIKSRSRTGTFWIQYIEMIDILRFFRRAEYTGNWTLFLHSLERMLPYFAASGHFNYLKSVIIFLQKMRHLEKDHRHVYEYFLQGFHVIRRKNDYWGAVSCDLYIEQELMRYMKSRGGVTRGGGMTEYQILTWSLARPLCSDVSQNIDSLIGKVRSFERRNVDASPCRMERDMKDVEKLVQFFKSARIFSAPSSSLRSIATGKEAQNHVNADSAVEVGNAIISGMIGKKIEDIKFCKKDLVVTMDAEATSSNTKSHSNIDSVILFQRLVSIGQNGEDFPDLFKYEMSSLPASLFGNDGLIRDSSKHQMKEALTVRGGHVARKPSDISVVVFDGGSLLHALRWPRGKTYLEVISMYISYIKDFCHSSTACVIFDGYSNGPSTKDEAHARRYGRVVAISSIDFTANMTVSLKQTEFLANPVNKSRFIAMLSEHLTLNSIETYTAPGDADVLVAFKAIELAHNQETLVVAEDTDILILLLHHLSPTHRNVHLISNGNKCKKNRVLHINAMQEKLGNSICRSVLFLHAFLGCDKTSRLYGVSRKDVIEKFSTSDKFSEISQVFLNSHAEEKDIYQAGLRAFLLTYGGKDKESLNKLRFRKFFAKVRTNSKAVEPQTLPPTEDAALYHLRRVYIQVQTWIGNNSLHPEDWGWILKNGKYEAVKMSLPPAPEKLLQIIKCNCKGDCSSSRCSCKKNNLPCTLACGHCRGTCANAQELIDSTDSDTEESTAEIFPTSDDELEDLIAPSVPYQLPDI